MKPPLRRRVQSEVVLSQLDLIAEVIRIHEQGIEAVSEGDADAFERFVIGRREVLEQVRQASENGWQANGMEEFRRLCMTMLEREQTLVELAKNETDRLRKKLVCSATNRRNIDRYHQSK